MQVRIRETGAVMYEGEFRALHPNTSFPLQIDEATLDAFGADVVFEGPQASGGNVYQYSQAAGVKQVDGKWYTKYILGPVFTGRPATDTEPAQTAAEQEAAYKAMKDEEQAKSVRTSRNDKLKECDWTQITDATVDKEVWATYRQALRDVTVQTGFPWNVVWPTQPE
jgi:hypothetical protein